MRLAVLADIHSNLDALTAVMEALDTMAVDRLVCLGDLVGYNAHPSACIALARARIDHVVQGNHDREAAGHEATIGTSSVARAAQNWTRSQLSDDEMQWLRALPNSHSEPGVYIAVHGCYLNTEHVNGYITETMLAANLVALSDNPAWPQVAFCGHTHVPRLAWQRHGAPHNADPREQFTWPADAEAVLINPGSVGQPRDGDPRAAFATVDLEARRLDVHRVAYDIDAAQRAIRAACLPESLALRLAEGC